MAYVQGVNTRELAATTGSPLVMELLGPVAGNQSFIDGVGDTNTTTYRLKNGNAWEHGVGTVDAGSPNTFTREATPRFGSSDGGASITIDTGFEIEIWSAYPQDVLALLDLVLNGTFQLKNFIGTRVGSYADFSLRNARGTSDVPLYLQADMNVGGVTFYGWSEDLDDWVPAGSLLVQAAENWGANARGVRMVLSSHLLGGLGEEWRAGYSTEFTISDAGKTANTSVNNANSTIIGTSGNSGGKVYVEFITHITGNSYHVWGITKGTQANNVLVGNDTNGLGLYRRGDQANLFWLLNGAQTNTGMPKPSDGQIIGVAYDLTTGASWVRNVSVDANVWYGINSGSPDPVAGTDGFSFTPFGASMFLAYTSASNGTVEGATIVSGALGFNADAPTDFDAWNFGAGMVDGLVFWEDGGITYGGLSSMGIGTLNTLGYFKNGVALITGDDVGGSLPNITSGHLIGNSTGGSAVAGDTSLTALIDQALGNTRGAILYRGATGWAILSPGTSGRFLETLGAGADPAWADVSGGSTPTIAAGTLLANATGSAATAAETSLTALIDAAIGNTRGSVLYRGAAGWALRTPGTAGDVFTTAGAGADPTWETPSAGGTKYIIAGFVSGVLAASQSILYHRFSKAVTIPANFGAHLGHTSKAGGTANATASTVLNIDKAATALPNSFSNVGTITIAASSVTPTFASAGGADITFAEGDVLRIQGPASADTTFAGFYATLVGYET